MADEERKEREDAEARVIGLWRMGVPTSHICRRVGCTRAFANACIRRERRREDRGANR